MFICHGLLGMRLYKGNSRFFIGIGKTESVHIYVNLHKRCHVSTHVRLFSNIYPHVPLSDVR
jgi:hypothetical protein